MSGHECVDLTLLDSDSDDDDQENAIFDNNTAPGFHRRSVERTDDVLPLLCESSLLGSQQQEGHRRTSNPPDASLARNDVCEPEASIQTDTEQQNKQEVRPETSKRHTTKPSPGETQRSEEDPDFTSSPATQEIEQSQTTDISEPQEPATNEIEQSQTTDIPEPQEPIAKRQKNVKGIEISEEQEKMDRNLTLRVGFFGNLSVGKSTILNTILGERYNPTSLKRETSGIRVFQVIRHIGQRTLSHQKRKAIDIAPFPSHETAMDFERAGQVRNIREQIQKDNDIQHDRETLGTPMEIPIDMPRNFLGDQREDVALSFVDIPGLNEPKQDMYSNWVADNWASFDCAIIVLDTTQECSAQDVRCLLNLVQKCHTEIREIPIVFVANKRDDVSNPSLKEMVDRLLERLQATFEGILEIESYEVGSDWQLTPLGPKQAAFVPMSAQYALLFEVAKRGSSLGHDQGKKEFMAADVDFALIDQFGLEEVGKNKWKRLENREDKIARVYDELKDKELLQARIRDANFGAFEKVLKATICGKEQQTLLLRSQLEWALKKPVPYTCMYDHLCETQEKAVVLEQSTDLVVNFFWEKYEKYEQDAKQKLSKSVDHKALAVSAFLLTVFHKFSVKFELSSYEMDKVTKAFKELVQLQINLVLKKFHLYWKEHPPRAPPRPPGCPTWDSMSSDEWATIFDSLLLAADGYEIKNTFGPDVIAITRALRKVVPHTSDCCLSSDIPIPDSMDDDSHWGYVIYSYCKFIRLNQAV